MLISGISNYEKCIVLGIIEKYYIKEYDYIVIYCPTFSINDTYDRKIIYNTKNIIIVDIDDN